jgi:hypothetical protein
MACIVEAKAGSEGPAPQAMETIWAKPAGRSMGSAHVTIDRRPIVPISIGETIAKG